MSYDEYADEAAYAEQQAAYEAEQERAYQEYAETPCAGCQHPRHWHTDGGIEHRLRTGMPCIAEDPDVADEERGVECNCLGWWEPGTDCPYDDEEEVVPTEIVEEPNMPVGGGVFYHEKVFEQFAKLGGQGAYQLGKEVTEEMFGGPVEPGPDGEEALPTCPKCNQAMVAGLSGTHAPIWWCGKCEEKRPRSLDGMSTVEEHKEHKEYIESILHRLGSPVEVVEDPDTPVGNFAVMPSVDGVPLPTTVAYTVDPNMLIVCPLCGAETAQSAHHTCPEKP